MAKKKQDGLALLVMEITISYIMILKYIMQIISDVVSYVHGLPKMMEFGLEEAIMLHQGLFYLGKRVRVASVLL
ncbi:hypothetical protein F2Q70_00018456 [Brassica cretica]|uniref:Uncharacterized protein n=1 Tax=Brassica cretica TaxID=69181 RepID=A0A8S9HTQ7_BRACR|nr:hypothetical protein F2Q70_00018456 [Brassica cretica]KAF2596501.1 hypothetical protein F2Q68_00011841 [Brassica cretica]